jgi:hypothetical protein
VRQTDLVIRLSSYIRSKEFLEAFLDVYEAKFRDYGDFEKVWNAIF